MDALKELNVGWMYEPSMDKRVLEMSNDWPKLFEAAETDVKGIRLIARSDEGRSFVAPNSKLIKRNADN